MTYPVLPAPSRHPLSSSSSSSSSLYIQSSQLNLKKPVPVLNDSTHPFYSSSNLKRDTAYQTAQYYKAIHYYCRKHTRQLILNRRVKEDEKKCMDQINEIVRKILLEHRMEY